MRAAMWAEARKLREIATSYLNEPFAEAAIRPLAEGLLRVSYVVEGLLAEHGPEIDLLGRTVVRDAQGRVTALIEKEARGG